MLNVLHSLYKLQRNRIFTFDDKIEMLDEDPFNPDPYTLHDILDEIEDAKMEMKEYIY